MELKKAVDLVIEEYYIASKKHIPFHSPHEGYAIIQEELDELWGAIRKTRHFRERGKEMRIEAIQIGAMAIRFLVDLIEE